VSDELPKGGFRMASEFCRESAVLIFVFGNLDVWFKSFTGELGRLPLSPWAVTKHVIAIFAVAGAFEASGILLEKWRQK
jgi:hypothetical protein